MTRQQEARRYIDKHGVDKAQRLIENVICNAEFYKERTGSYYLSYNTDCISLNHLRKAILEYKTLMQLKSSYETRLNHWRM